MTDYALDTDTLSLVESGHSEVVRRVFAVPPDQRSITAVTVRERIDGWYGLLGRVKTAEEEAAVYQRIMDTVRVCAAVRILPYTIAAVARFRQLQAMKRNVRPMDLRIAAVALEHNAVRVTRNARDFARVPGLTTEDWTQPASPDGV